MKVKLPVLPYSQDALAPHISEKTIQFHYGKHHNAYVENTIKMITGTELENKTLEEIIMASFNKVDRIALFNNAAQVWNHTFYWECMKPHGGGEPVGTIKNLIENKYGSLDNFIEEFKKIAMSQFGSGWAWLVLGKNDLLDIVKTSNAATPLTDQVKPLLTVDVWEHAYYLDYQNRRADYLTTFFEYLIDWDAVDSRL